MKRGQRLDCIVAALTEHGPMTCTEIAAVIGVTPKRVRDCISVHHRGGAERRVHISSWIRNQRDVTGSATGGAMMPVYSPGARRDAPKPAALSKRETDAAWWARYGDAYNARRRVKRDAMGSMAQQLMRLAA